MHPIPPISAAAIRLALAIALVAGGMVAGAAEVADTKFNVARGFFETPFLLEITTATSGAQIRFTTDGSAPDLSNGQDYTGPFAINRTTVVRAAAFKDGLDPTNVDTNSYIFLDDVIRQTGSGMPADWGEHGNFDTEPNNLPPGPYAADYAMDPDVVDHLDYASTIKDDLRAIPTLSVSLHPAALFSSEIVATDGMGTVTESRGIYPIGKGFERAASAELILPDGSSGFQIDCSIEVQGASSTDRWKTDKLSMRLKFKSPYGPSELDYPLFGDDATDSINTVILDATNQQAWTHPDPLQQPRAQYIRDQLVGDYQNATGGIAPHGRYAHLYLDGIYWGMYWMHEFVDEAFTVAYRGGDKDDYDVLRHRADNVVSGNADGFAALLDAVGEDLTVAANYGAVADLLDIDGFADYILINFYAGNGDWAFQNWNASYHRIDPARKWLFHNWDAEKTFQFATDDVTEADDTDSPTHIHQRLLANDEYRLAFADRVHKHLFNGGILTPTAAAATYLDRLSQIDRAVVGESARWGDNRNPADPPFTRATWAAERDRLLADYFPARTGNVLAQMQADGLYPVVATPTFNQHGGAVAPGFALVITDPSGIGQVYYTDDGSDPRDPGGAESASANAGVALTVNTSVRVKARVRASGGEWSALTDAVFTVGGALADLRVTEIMFNPADPSGDEVAAGFDDADLFEYIELRNTGASPIELEGITFTDGVMFTFGADVLGAGDRIVVVNDFAAFEERYGVGAASVAGEFGGSLSNSGERLSLTGAFGEPVQGFSYDDDWHPTTDGGGHSLVIVDDGAALSAWNTAGGWRASTFSAGSPGSAESAPPAIRITEIHYRPASASDGEKGAGFSGRDGFEFVELRNVGSTPVDLAGFMFSEAVDFTFPTLVLGSGAFAVVVADSGAFAERYGGGATVAGAFTDGSLADSGERIVLSGAAGEVIHDFEYSDGWYPATDGPGASLVVVDDALPTHRWSESSQWRASSLLHGSPGGVDPAPTASPIRISELMFNPPEPSSAEMDAGFNDKDQFEFIELVNIGSTVVDLLNYELVGAVILTFKNFTLDPGERAVVVRDENAFRERYGPLVAVIDEYNGGLSNDFEEVILRDSLGGIVLQFTYEGDWYAAADGGGRSLTIIDPLAHPVFWREKDGWRPGGAVGGSPGLSPDPFFSWVWGEFSDSEALDPSQSAPGVDAEGDGLINLFEFAFNTNPERAGERGYFESAIEIDGEYYLAVTYRMNASADTAITAHFSSDLKSWTIADPQFDLYISDVAADGTPRVTIIDTVPMSASEKRFVRLLVSR
jgi:hypothetical protein